MPFNRTDNSHALDDFWSRTERDWRAAETRHRPHRGAASETPAATEPDLPAAVGATPAATDLPTTDLPTTDLPTTDLPTTPAGTAPTPASPTTATDALAPATDAAATAAPSAGATALTRHDGTVYATSGSVIENLDIYVTEGAGIVAEEASDVTIRNVRIHFNTDGLDSGEEGAGAGIMGIDAANMTIENVEIINTGAPASGPNTDPEQYGIGLFTSPGAQVRNVTVRDASTGIYLQDSPNAALEGIEGYNMRGPYPRGQLVQFNHSDNSTLEGFYNYNDLETSWTEDNINIGSNNVTVSNGLIDGNNSPSGVGVIIEGGTGVQVSNVDTVHTGNGAFSDYGTGNIFDHVRAFDSFTDSHAGRGTPLSGGLIFSLTDGSTITNASYQNPGAPENVVYGGGIQDEAFTGTFQAQETTGAAPMAAWHNTFGWA